MTDVPAFALQMLCLLAGQRALRSKTPSTTWFVASLGLALAAFSIREYGIAAGFAVSVVVLSRAWSVDRRLASRLAAIAAAGLMCAIALFVWRSGLAHSTPTKLALSPSHLRAAVPLLWAVAVTVALFVSPAVFAVSPVRLVKAVRTRVPIMGIVIVLAALALAATWHPELLGNYFTPEGSYAETVPGPEPYIVPDRAWSLLNWLGLASLVVVTLVAAVTLGGRRRRADRVGPQTTRRSRLRPPDLSRPAALVGVFTASTVAIAVVVIMATTAPFFDRYLIGLIPFVAALVIKAGRDHELLVRRAGRTATISLAALAFLGLIFVDASATFDGGKWKLASAVEHQGFGAGTIDGGFEWFGYHQADPTEPRPATDGRSFWVTEFSDRPVCATSTLQTPPIQRLPDAETDPDVIESLTVRSLLGVDYRLTAVAGPQRCNDAPASNEPKP